VTSRKRKRQHLLAALVVACSSQLLGCTLALQRDGGQCEANADCQALGTDYVCASDRVCVRFESDARSVGNRAGDECGSHADCAGSIGLALCRSGLCKPLNSETKGCVSVGWGTTSPSEGSDLLPLGMLVPKSELGGADLGRYLTGAVGTAINELNRAREEQALLALPPLVGVACDEGREDSIEYLVSELEVRLIIGPVTSSRVEDVLDQTGEGALLLAPFAEGPDLQPEPGDSPGVVVSCSPNRSGVRGYLVDAIVEARARIAELAARGLENLEKINPALAVSNDEATAAFARELDPDQLADAGVLRIEYTTEAGGRGLVAALEGLDRPANLVVAASAEDAWAENIAAFDNRFYQDHDYYPYYLLAGKRASVRERTIGEQATASDFPPQYQRLLGLDYHRSDRTRAAYDDFSTAFRSHTRGVPDPGLELAYDCTYVAVYVAVAAEQRSLLSGGDVTPQAFVTALGAVHGGGRKLPVRALDIPNVLGDLVSSRGSDGSVDLIGASGDLDFEGGRPAEGSSGGPHRAYFHPAAPDGELYCIDDDSKDFCDTGIVFPAAGGMPTSEEVNCKCLGID
jgi:hypothetical protein